MMEKHQRNIFKQKSYLTQHKRFVLYDTRPNSAFVGTPFILRTLYEMAKLKVKEEYEDGKRSN